MEYGWLLHFTSTLTHCLGYFKVHVTAISVSKAVCLIDFKDVFQVPSNPSHSVSKGYFLRLNYKDYYKIRAAGFAKTKISKVFL